MAMSRLEIEMSMNLARLQTDTGKAVKMMEGMKKEFMKITAGITLVGLAYQFKQMVTETINAADSLNDLRTRSGLTGQQLLLLEGAAIRGGGSLESISDVVSKLSKRLGAADFATSEAGDAFAAMEINVRESSGELKSMDKILAETGAKFRTYNDGLAKAALGNAAFGKGGDRLIPIVEGLDDTAAAFKRLGIAIKEDFITAADKYNDTLADLRSVQGVFNRMLVAELIPYMQAAADKWALMSSNQGEMKGRVEAAVNLVKGLVTAFYTLYKTLELVTTAVVTLQLTFVTLITSGPLRAIEEWKIGFDRMKKSANEFGSTWKMIWSQDGPPKPEVSLEDNFWSTVDKWEKNNKKDPPNIVDREKAKKEAAELKKAFDAMQSAVDKGTLEMKKDQFKREQQLLDMAHADGLMSEHEFFDKKTVLRQQAYDYEFGALLAQQQQLEEAAKKIKPNTKEYWEAMKDIAELGYQLAGVQRDFGQESKVSFLDAEKATEKYADSLVAIRAELLALKGDELGAARARRSLETRDLRRKFPDDAEAQGLITQREELLDIQSEMTSEKEKYDLTLGKLQLSEQRIARTQASGAISELEAMRQLGDERKKAVDQLELFVSNYERLAASSGSEKLKQDAERMREELKKLGEEADVLAQKFNTIFGDAFADAFADFITGTKSMKDAFKSFANAVLRDINRLVANDIKTRLFGGNSSGGGGFGEILSKWFGGGGGNTSAAADALSGGAVSSAVELSGVMAEGGSVFGGKTYLVGEKGPELFRASGSGSITPNDQLGGSMTVNNVFHINGNADSRTQAQIASAAGQSVRRAMARNT